ncbi:MFS transporter [Pseudoteredinibacter isoporae]|uniref:MFS family permease n=1 Tax=Pseudoteredinibacter isoporae TaxID=570281 RepID=A0A7X0MYI5_9GAMM|nr:MFS transporter [Pseudoteredinibacter isoporae]MBB6522062.1 MFS family permease [Pseudoteredinibacter isoporae]NHO87597.1 MFS transporter [Pseudoteredinibacter isoporae]NIB24072.1 MFS transporter [Pseudoteredinibacter isoporae]
MPAPQIPPTDNCTALPTQAVSPGRWRIPLVLMITMYIGYLDRMNISLALPLIAEEMQWSLSDKQYYGGLLMSCFYLAYGLANLFLTPFAAKLGPRRSLLIIIVLWSIFTSLGAIFSHILLLFVASRILLGVSEGTHVPMMNQLTKNWFEDRERSRATGIWMAGLFMAILTGPLLLVPVMHQLGWRSGFHLLAIAGLVLSLPLVYFIVQDHPPKQAEQNAFDNTGAQQRQALWQVIRSPAYIAAQCMGIFNNMLAVGISNWMPSYLSSRQDVEYSDLAYLNTIPYVFSLLALLFFSWLGDRTSRRSRNAAICFFLGGLTLFLSFNQASLFVTMMGFTLGVCCITAFTACEHPIVQTLFPQHLVAQGSGIFNGTAMILGGGLGTFFIGQLMADSNSQVNIWPLFFLCVAASISGLFLHRFTRF